MPDVRDLTYDECVSVLDHTGLGKVAVSTPMGPRIIAVNYVVVGDSIVFRTSPSSTLGTYARNSTLAFEVGRPTDDEHHASSVVAVGRADMVNDPAEMRRIAQIHDPEPWGDSRRSTFFKMPWSTLSGTRMRVVGAAPAGRPARAQVVDTA
jgi:nitroimidazol reductase NimA-like FMN-containing flavoprotein (pyridoxamine 5'-phosphate oxidase superfamily)